MTYTFKSINPVYRAERALHTRQLGKPMWNIPMVGDPPMSDGYNQLNRRTEVYRATTGTTLN